MSELALAKALEPVSIAVRTLDLLHLATIEFLRGRPVALTRYDNRLPAAA
jgi:hypothetical protein